VAESVYPHFRPFLHELRTVRLGALNNGCLDAERTEATLAVLLEYQAILRQLDVSKPRVVATAAVRAAANRDQFIAAVAETLGWTVEVLSGEEEAGLSFLGAIGNAAINQPLLLIDIGGGSTELIRSDGNLANLQLQSADIGAVRAQVQGWDIAKIATQVAQNFIPQATDTMAKVVGVGGTVTTAVALLQGCQKYDRTKVEGYQLTLKMVKQLLVKLEPLNIAERCAFSPLLSERGEIIVEGLWILQAIMQHLQLETIIVSAGGVLEGCLRS
jgi:exopolyphosphatase/guanosine-5'-triphosphate,3'-diphosphate pyrophosphatase